jgi:hypothetical protein
MSYVDDVKVVKEYVAKQLRDANLVGLPATTTTLAMVQSLLRSTLEHLRETDAIKSRWDVDVKVDPVTHALTVTALPPWRDWTLMPYQHWRTLCLEPGPASDAEHTATRVTILEVKRPDPDGRRSIRYFYTDYALLGGEVVEFTGRDNDWEDDFRKKFPIPE